MSNLLDGGSINYSNGGFSVVSPNSMTPLNDPSVKFGTSAGSTQSQTLSNSKINTQAYVVPRVFPSAAPAPAPPDTSNLTSLQEKVRRDASIKKAMSDYDALYAATQASGFQTANNAGNVYANRLLQQGINPLASGVVRAQAKLPIYSQLAGIDTQKEQTRLDATNKADTLAASIASTIGQLQSNYAKTLADYNSQQTGYNLDFTKFNANLGQQQSEYQSDYALKAAQIALQTRAAGSGGGGGGSGSVPNGVIANPLLTPGFDPGYIPNQGPIHGSSINPNIVYIGGGGVRY